MRWASLTVNNKDLWKSVSDAEDYWAFLVKILLNLFIFAPYNLSNKVRIICRTFLRLISLRVWKEWGIVENKSGCVWTFLWGCLKQKLKQQTNWCDTIIVSMCLSDSKQTHMFKFPPAAPGWKFHTNESCRQTVVIILRNKALHQLSRCTMLMLFIL